ncbi:MAG TPA: hypothetical protein VM452_19350 [Caulifigura sp.]|jgi:hypothetical protein|nr:hypothetical protein [Caulifigura sp.]
MTATRFTGARRLVALCFLAAGCAGAPYRFGASDTRGINSSAGRLVSQGAESPRLDRLERVLESPSRLPLIPDPPPDAPGVETLAALEEYLDRNGIGDLHIAIGEYEPRRHWLRIRANRQLNGFWKYPLGSIGWVLQTTIPDRVIDRTFYSPYSNTLVINSDDLPEVLAAAAYAKDIRARTWRGPYALMANLPFVSMVHTVASTSDVLSYARHHDDWELERDSYRRLYPGLGADAASAVIPVSTIFLNPLVRMGGGLVGRSVAEVQVARLEKMRSGRINEAAQESLLAGTEEVPERQNDQRVTPVDAVFQDEDQLRAVTFPEQ